MCDYSDPYDERFGDFPAFNALAFEMAEDRTRVLCVNKLPFLGKLDVRPAGFCHLQSYTDAALYTDEWYALDEDPDFLYNAGTGEFSLPPFSINVIPLNPE
ncbi:hypothetical protein H5P28_15955 [Ruficoccus amylovorans]|uniref:Uncharacterized protein n=1 Tax=Ruficoccus amylovorans TaxID=1804625 RepID=A0A842HH71_9BACT|nr:hypothetical protein [Ruficoccus amylovorans]MBC2595762.1 hypothetical protein [Ruficoccus amylovorans]